MLYTYIFYFKSYDPAEFSTIIVKILGSFKSKLNINVHTIKRSTNKITVLRAPQVYKDSREQFQITLFKKKICFSFQSTVSSTFMDRFIKDLICSLNQMNTDFYLVKKLNFKV